MYHVNVNVNLVEGNVVDRSVKSVMYIKNIMLGIILLVVVNMEHI